MKSMNHRHAKNSAAHVIEVFLKNITRSLPGYIFWKNTSSVYLGCNENFARLVGLRSVEEIAGKTDMDFNWQPSGHTADIFRKGDQDTLNGHPITDQQETLVLPNGRKLVTLVSKLPIIDDDGRPLGIVGYFTDITALKEKECELRQAKQQADAANQAKSVFIMNISHDIRTPLSGLLGMARILEQEVQSVTGKAAAADLIKAGKGLLNFLNEVIEFSKYESGDLPVYDMKFNLQELVDNIIALLMPSAQEKQLSLHLTYDSRIPQYLIGDATRLHRIILNLMTNAIKFTPQGTVDLRLQLIQHKRQRIVVQCQIQDTGIGIPADKQALIFTRFERLHPSYQGQYAGPGLGLALVKQFISALDGEITIDSEENKGSTFTCLIPLRVALPLGGAQASLPSLPPLPTSSGNDSPGREGEHSTQLTVSSSTHILVVEDHPIVQRAIKSQLESFGLSVVTADNGEQALKKVQYEEFDLILLDIGLPDQDGCAVAMSIHQWQQQNERPESFMVALSAHIDDSTQQRCLAAGMIKVFSKPLDAEKMQEILALLQSDEKDEKDEKTMTHFCKKPTACTTPKGASDGKH